MAIRQRTWRNVDGERIEGTWRHAFIRNGGNYFLTDLLIYADGMVDCWGLETLEGFAGKLASGWVATDLPEGAKASAHHLASWKFAEPKSWLTPEMLLGEVRDDIDNLNGRPDSTRRCLAAVDAFRQQPTEVNRTAVREAYEAIPGHLRRYALGDMDRKDFPLRVIVNGPGNQIELWNGKTVDVTEEMHASALEYFAEREQLRKQHETKSPADGPTEPVESSIHLNQVVFPRGWPENPGTHVLRNEFPAPIVMGSRTYPTVAHAHWALAVADEHRQAEVLSAERPYDAQKLAENSTLRDDWPQVRVAVMARLLRAKFQQHPEFAETLMATGATRLIYTEVGSSFWGQRGLEGQNWMGRLLELTRSELVAAELDILQ
ncbi:NADAR family protein [Streptomyces brevispora]|uniref:NADAR family protein n=1 Tax=Streptomyces brevispora TaxID=887462 RepID=A0ABZ1G044_9ACTN|nr:NADAR family protein [Streptomyces brevispora]WSC12658.1 NADAR family protein [Streptomyces brevispora]